MRLELLGDCDSVFGYALDRGIRPDRYVDDADGSFWKPLDAPDFFSNPPIGRGKPLVIDEEGAVVTTLKILSVGGRQRGRYPFVEEDSAGFDQGLFDEPFDLIAAESHT